MFHAKDILIVPVSHFYWTLTYYLFHRGYILTGAIILIAGTQKVML